MKVGIILDKNGGHAKAIMDKTEGNTLGITLGCEAVFVENPLEQVEETGLPTINTCIGIKNLLLNKELKDAFNRQIGIDPAPVFSSFFSLFSGTRFSDWLEVSYSGRFMAGEVGCMVGFSTGTGLRVNQNILEAFPSLVKLQEFLSKIEYHGEVLVHVSDRFTLVGVQFGHFYGHFSMFAEVSKVSVQDLLTFMLGQNPASVEVHDSIVVSSLVSQFPFPCPASGTILSLSAPKNAEKHLWRMPVLLLNQEVVLVTVHGLYLGEARKRLRRTIENMLAYNDFLQYRNDYGLHTKFLLEQGRYEGLCTSPFQQKKEDSMKVPITTESVDKTPGV